MVTSHNSNMPHYRRDERIMGSKKKMLFLFCLFLLSLELIRSFDHGFTRVLISVAAIRAKSRNYVCFL